MVNGYACVVHMSRMEVETSLSIHLSDAASAGTKGSMALPKWALLWRYGGEIQRGDANTMALPIHGISVAVGMVAVWNCVWLCRGI